MVGFCLFRPQILIFGKHFLSEDDRMERVLEIKSDETTITIPVRISLRAGRIYRTEFGRDLIADLAALYQKTTIDNQTKLFGVLREKNIDFADETAVTQAIMENADLLLMTQDQPLSFSDTERAGQILWAFAKNSNEQIPGAEAWIDSFDILIPYKEVISTVYSLWQQASSPTIELKNG